jgi:hypothetical protein
MSNNTQSDMVQTVEFCTIDNREMRPYVAQLGFKHALTARLTVEMLDCLGYDDLAEIDLVQPLVATKVYEALPAIKPRALGMAMLNRLKSLDANAYQFLIELDKLTLTEHNQFALDMDTLNHASNYVYLHSSLSQVTLDLLPFISTSVSRRGAKWTVYGKAVSAYFRFKLPQEDR